MAAKRKNTEDRAHNAPSKKIDTGAIAMSSPTVVRIRREGGKIVEPCDVYIGRKVQTGGWQLAWSKWAIPHQLSKKHPTAAKVLPAYEAYVRSKPQLMADLHELGGKRLGCWCHPDPCHGDVLIKLYDEWVCSLQQGKSCAESK